MSTGFSKYPIHAYVQNSLYPLPNQMTKILKESSSIHSLSKLCWYAMSILYPWVPLLTLSSAFLIPSILSCLLLLRKSVPQIYTPILPLPQSSPWSLISIHNFLFSTLPFNSQVLITSLEIQSKLLLCLLFYSPL